MDFRNPPLLIQLALSGAIAFGVARLVTGGKDTVVAPRSSPDTLASRSAYRHQQPNWAARDSYAQRGAADNQANDALEEVEQTEQPPKSELSYESQKQSFKEALEFRITNGQESEWSADASVYIEESLSEFLAESDQDTTLDGVQCTSSGCVIELSHESSSSSVLFQKSVMEGEVLNTPRLLNQESGCNLHSVGSAIGDRKQRIFIDCKQ